MTIRTFIKIELRHSAEGRFNTKEVARGISADLSGTIALGETIAVVVVRGTRDVFFEVAVVVDREDVEVRRDFTDSEGEGCDACEEEFHIDLEFSNRRKYWFAFV